MDRKTRIGICIISVDMLDDFVVAGFIFSEKAFART